MNKAQPHRETLWISRGGEMIINYDHPLSDGFGIPAIVTDCPDKRSYPKYSGLDEFGEKVSGISFDDCLDCNYFAGLGLGQEISCGRLSQ